MVGFGRWAGLLGGWVWAFGAGVWGASGDEGGVSFSRDVLPILSGHCFACHGPDPGARKAGYRLDVESEAKRVVDGVSAIVPGDPEGSELLDRIGSDDPNYVMPPPEANKPLSAEQAEVLRRWIAEGAAWGRHWAFEPVVRPPGSLDDQVRAELERHGLRLRERARAETLVRRLSLDLIGLPPERGMVERFAADPSEEAYRGLVEELLASPRFGEHWARMWLDLARYADTKGYEKDLGRTMWPYRDWVVEAFNADLPLDRFTAEQLAGDLLPEGERSEGSIVATAFHRNTMSNDEGGTDDEEFRVAAVKDRVDTTIQVWMGLTMGCAKCHSHKYDPITMEDYYRFYAVFNQTEDADRYDDAPTIEWLTEADRARRAELEGRIGELEAALSRAAEAGRPAAEAAERAWRFPRSSEGVSSGGATLSPGEDGSISVSGEAPERDTYVLTFDAGTSGARALRLEALPWRMSNGREGLGRNPDDPNFVVSELRVEASEDGGETWRSAELKGARSDFAQGGWPVEAVIDGDEKTGWAVSPRSRERHVALFGFAEPIPGGDARIRVTIVQNYGNRLNLGRFRIGLSDADPDGLVPIFEAAEVRAAREALEAGRKALSDFNAGVARLPIMRELPEDRRRTTRIHRRGNFLEPGEEVEPALLSAFPFGYPGSGGGRAPTRLDAARWLTSVENPLTPRVWANRIWARVFGAGIVETEEDFGALGAAPSNPRLLDWLAAEYRDNGWSLKGLLRAIATSETYRQASSADEASTAVDPRNVLASRGARYRLSAEAVRDQALAVAGLLSSKTGGPSVMPPQPAGLWRSTYSGRQWVDAEGEDRYRRGLYTYLKRTTPYPSFLTFDGGSGEVCQIRRVRTNTPLQALVTLNDPVYMEAAAGLARRLTTEGGAEASDAESRARLGMRLALGRPASAEEARPLARLFEAAAAAYRAAPGRAAELIETCRGNPGDVPPEEFAAWIAVSNAILNLDEFLTRN